MSAAPISLESIEQVQVSVAPFDVRQRQLRRRGGQHRHACRLQHAGRLVLPPLPQRRLRGHRGCGPGRQPRHVHLPQHGRLGGVVRSSRTACSRSAPTRTRRPAGRWTPSWPIPVAPGRSAATSRVCCSRIWIRSARLSRNFNYTTGPHQNLPADTPAKRYLFRTDLNLNNRNKVSFRYNQLTSSSGKLIVELDERRHRTPDELDQLAGLPGVERRPARTDQVRRR